MSERDATKAEKIAAVQLVLAVRDFNPDRERQLDMIGWILGGEDGDDSTASVTLFIDAIKATGEPSDGR